MHALLLSLHLHWGSISDTFLGGRHASSWLKDVLFPRYSRVESKHLDLGKGYFLFKK